MIIRDVKFKSNAKNERLIQDFEENLVDLADQLAVCQAEIRKWKAFERAAAQVEDQGQRVRVAAAPREDRELGLRGRLHLVQPARPAGRLRRRPFPVPAASRRTRSNSQTSPRRSARAAAKATDP